MNRRCNDQANAECRSTDYNRQGKVLFFDELLPQVIRREFIHDDETGDEDHDAEHGIDHGVEEDGKVHGGEVKDEGEVM